MSWTMISFLSVKSPFSIDRDHWKRRVSKRAGPPGRRGFDEPAADLRRFIYTMSAQRGKRRGEEIRKKCRQKRGNGFCIEAQDAIINDKSVFQEE
ncbi:hypothetical protein [Pyramidobacter sp.]|uniref:hypothetical protein n=1 Tax=Pyramidobacter sp. TaxID=1943581 RepID=UPI0025FCD194|nr:hypothetical protein [Pyramidobacter sp.]MCI7402859.1 hypothetical protein [Pyramidobacter sp.]MDY3213504.1 hypothetical protein [Pyramidobacter sp.]